MDSKPLSPLPVLERHWPALLLAVLPVLVHLPAYLGGLQVDAWFAGLPTWHPWALRLGLMALAGLATRHLLLGIGLGNWPATLAACLYQLNGGFAWFGQGVALEQAALPCLLLGIEQARTHRLPAWLTLGAGLLMLCPTLAEPPALALAIAWGLTRLRTDWRGWGLAIAAGGLGHLLFLPKLLGEFAARLPPAQAFVPADAALTLFPYVFGDPTAPIAVTGREAAIWAHGGGYLDLTWATLALSGLRGGGKLGPLRLGLGLFLAITLALACGLAPQLASPTNLLPCWCLAAATLASLTLADWQAGLAAKFRRTLVLLAPILPLTLMPVYLNMLGAISERRHGLAFPGLILGPSICIGLQLAFTIAISALIRHAPTEWRRRWLTALLAANALSLFTWPMLNAALHRAG